MTYLFIESKFNIKVLLNLNFIKYKKFIFNKIVKFVIHYQAIAKSISPDKTKTLGTLKYP